MIKCLGVGEEEKYGHSGPTCKPADTGLGFTDPTDAERPKRAGSWNTPETPGNSGQKLVAATGLKGPLGTEEPTLAAIVWPKVRPGTA